MKKVFFLLAVLSASTLTGCVTSQFKERELAAPRLVEHDARTRTAEPFPSRIR